MTDDEFVEAARAKLAEHVDRLIGAWVEHDEDVQRNRNQVIGNREMIDALLEAMKMHHQALQAVNARHRALAARVQALEGSARADPMA